MLFRSEYLVGALLAATEAMMQVQVLAASQQPQGCCPVAVFKFCRQAGQVCGRTACADSCSTHPACRRCPQSLPCPVPAVAPWPPRPASAGSSGRRAAAPHGPAPPSAHPPAETPPLALPPQPAGHARPGTCTQGSQQCWATGDAGLQIPGGLVGRNQSTNNASHSSRLCRRCVVSDSKYLST